MPVSMGGYEHPTRRPTTPILLHCTATPTELGMPPREGVKVGRQNLYKHDVRGHGARRCATCMARSLGGGGFDPADDIQAITDQPLGTRLLLRVRHAVGQRRSTPDGPLARRRGGEAVRHASSSPTPTVARRPTSTGPSTRPTRRSRSCDAPSAGPLRLSGCRPQGAEDRHPAKRAGLMRRSLLIRGQGERVDDSTGGLPVKSQQDVIVVGGGAQRARLRGDARQGGCSGAGARATRAARGVHRHVRPLA